MSLSSFGRKSKLICDLRNINESYHYFTSNNPVDTLRLLEDSLKYDSSSMDDFCENLLSRECALIPAGTFQMGTNFYRDNGNWDLHGAQEYHSPVRTVYVSAFFIHTTPVTCGEWKPVMMWAKSVGYVFENEGQWGASDKHAIDGVNWCDAVKWCNAKSEMEGLLPCYKVNGSVYRQGDDGGDVRDTDCKRDVTCDWNANGYRLPTEAEWEKSARGGLVGKMFPNGDTLSENDANFNGCISGRGRTAVKSHPPNGYGIYDMAGNVWEWCWDWWEKGYARELNDPRGPATGERKFHHGGEACKTVRGGDYGANPHDCYVFARYTLMGRVGFRWVRRADS
jgi:formylglycine-generating enzyme required for sulfatase activity